jgi:hypothetical protein
MRERVVARENALEEERLRRSVRPVDVVRELQGAAQRASSVDCVGPSGSGS